MLQYYSGQLHMHDHHLLQLYINSCLISRTSAAEVMKVCNKTLRKIDLEWLNHTKNFQEEAIAIVSIGVSSNRLHMNTLRADLQMSSATQTKSYTYMQS